jgi:hypothetical protein
MEIYTEATAEALKRLGSSLEDLPVADAWLHKPAVRPNERGRFHAETGL